MAGWRSLLLAATIAATGSAAMASPAAIGREWSHYDVRGRGSLTALEFGRWIMAANGTPLDAAVAGTLRSGAPGSTATRLLNATAAAFMRADADRDGLVSPVELVRFTQS